MDKNRSLSWNFAFEAIPILFHSSTDSFMRYLDKDGREFLVFYWNHVGDRLEAEKRVSPAGLTYSVDQVDKNTRLVIITLPSPKEDGDAYFLALVARPEKRFFFVRLPNTEAYVLNREDASEEECKTAFGYLSPRAIYQEKDQGLRPNKVEFKRVVMEMINKKKPEKKK
jgi:hypothetical protein